MSKKEKTIYDLVLHETLSVEEVIGVRELAGGKKEDIVKKYEVTRVPGGWVYAFDYPMFRQSPIVFIPHSNEYNTELLKKFTDSDKPKG